MDRCGHGRIHKLPDQAARQRPRAFAAWLRQTLALCAGAFAMLVMVDAGMAPSALAQASQPAATPAAKKKPAARKPKAKPAAAAPTSDPDGDAFPKGIAASTAGRHDEAVSLLSAAISGGKLKHRDLARALYLRGASYKATKKIALAIADLTNALYMRNGLAGEDRKQAMALRAASFAEGGLSDQGEQDPASIAEPRAPTAPEAAPRRTASAPAPPAAAPAVGAWQTSARPASAPPAITPKATARAARPATPPPSETATATPASWGGATTVAAPAAGVKPPAPSRAARAQIAAVAPPAVAPTTSVPRGLMIQAAAVRSQAEADAIARKATAGAGRQAYVDTTVMGNMGTFYRVLVGPYAKEADSRATCASLRKNGLDCLMVKR